MGEGDRQISCVCGKLEDVKHSCVFSLGKWSSPCFPQGWVNLHSTFVSWHVLNTLMKGWTEFRLFTLQPGNGPVGHR